MDSIVNYTVLYCAPLRELIVSKLACFFCKAVLQQKIRLTTLMPFDVEPSRVDRHKFVYDEVVIAKFDPSKSKFWETRNLLNFYYFLASTVHLDDQKHIYVDFGKVFVRPFSIPDSDIIVARKIDGQNEIMNQVNDKIAACCDISSLSGTLPYYDFSLFSVSDDSRLHMQKLIRQIRQNYEGYISQKETYAIMSWAVAKLKRDHDIAVSATGAIAVDIAHSNLIDDFYTLI